MDEHIEAAEQITLIVVLTPKVPLSKWFELGMGSRELALYKEISSRVKRIILINPSDRDESHLVSSSKIEVLQRNNYRLLSDPQSPHFVKGEKIIIKTNQMLSAPFALFLKTKLSGKLLIRTGYQLSDFCARQLSIYRPKTVVKFLSAILIEYIAFKVADGIVVTSLSAQKRITKIFRPKSEITIIPNFVDHRAFHPMAGIEKKFDVISVGRLAKQKHHEMLLHTLAGTNFNALIVGNGEEKEEIQQKAVSLGVQCTIHHAVEHDKLPRLLNSAKCFALFSDYEGDPKTLIEALSCGLPVLTRNTQGCDEIVESSKAGITVSGPDDAKAWLSKLTKSENLRSDLGKKGRQYIEQKRTLKTIVGQETEIYKRMMRQSK